MADSNISDSEKVGSVEKERNCLSRCCLGLFLLVVLIVGGAYLGYRYMTRPYESNAIAYTEWKVGEVVTT